MRKTTILSLTLVGALGAWWPPPARGSVNLASGELTHSETLFRIPSSRLMSDFTVTYSSFEGRARPLGTGWTHTFDIGLEPNNDGSWTLREGDGSRLTLYDRGGGHYSPKRASYPVLVWNPDGTGTLEKKEGIFYGFGGTGVIERISDRNSNAVDFTYVDGVLVRVDDLSGRAIDFTHDADGRLLTVTDPMGTVHSFQYGGDDLTGIASQVRDLGTRTWAFSYAANGFLRTRVDPMKHVTSYQYDADQRVASITDPDGADRGYAYDPEDCETQVTEGDGGVWTYRCDREVGALTEIVDPLGNRTAFTYDAGRNLKTLTNARGYETGYDYDASANLTRLTNALGEETKLAYGPLSQVTDVVYGDGATLSLRYDARGNLEKVIDPSGRETAYATDARGNTVSVRDALGRVATFGYDQRGYLVSLPDAGGGERTFTYDAGGYLVAERDPLGHETRLERNGLGWLTRITDPEGHESLFVYDLDGNIREAVDANGKRMAFRHDHRGHVTRVTDALGHSTLIAYGPGCACGGAGADEIESVTAARDRTTTFEYDLARHLLRETSPLGHTWSFQPDPVGNVEVRTDPNGKETRFEWDPLNRLASVRYASGDFSRFEYDARGNVRSAANQSLGYHLAYDKSRRLTSVQDSTGRTVSYEYDEMGNRRSMATPDGRIVEYESDRAGRPTEIRSAAGEFRLTYDGAGRRTSLRYPDGTTTSYTYSPSGRLTGIARPVNPVSYEYDAAGNVTAMTDGGGMHRYRYDDTYQLLEAVHPGAMVETFAYDSVGNRKRTRVDTENRLLQDGWFKYEYDRNGNLVGRAALRTGDFTRFAYDDENHLVEVRTSPRTLARYKYDAFGRRVEKDVNGQVTRFFYDGLDLVLEYAGSGEVQSRYVHGPAIDEPLALEGRGTSFYHADALGTVTGMSGPGGLRVPGYDYGAFGQPLGRAAAGVQPFRFTGRELDAETGLYCYRSRHYDPSTGRFLTQDPLGVMGGVNRYAYVANSPTNRADPLGLTSAVGHDMAFDLLTPVATPEAIEFLKAASREHDWATRRDNPAHYLRNPGEDAWTARTDAEAFIEGSIGTAIAGTRSGAIDEVWKGTAGALHAMAETLSEAHVRFGLPEEFDDGFLDWLKHAFEGPGTSRWQDPEFVATLQYRMCEAYRKIFNCR